MGRMKSGKGFSKNPKRKATAHADDSDDDMMNDEIDTFHKQRDIIPLDVNDSDDSDDETDLPVFDSKDDDDDDEDDDEDEDDEDMEDDSDLTGLAAKIARQQKYLRVKEGGVEDETHDDDEEAEEKETVWGRRKEGYYGGENVDYEIQSSDEELHDEEEEVLRLQREKVKSLSAEDFGLEHVSEDENEKEPTMEEILVGGVKAKAKALKEKEAFDNDDMAYEEVEKDLNALSKEEKMEVVYSSAPELVGLLSELNSAMDELENKVNPLLSKVKEAQNGEKGSINYIELKQLLLLAYCQSITFYLLLKSEGEPARDHPVTGRIVELKELLDKVKQLDSYLPDIVEDILSKKEHIKEIVKLPTLTSDGLAKNLQVVHEQPETMPKDALNIECTKDVVNKEKKRKRQNDQLGVQSQEMLKVRAALEEKLKHKGIINTIKQKDNKADRRLPLLNRKFETLDDFDDDTINPSENKVNSTSFQPSKLSRLVTSQFAKPKIISGDDDLPKRDDIGERRRKFELRVLSHAGIDTGDDMMENEPENLKKRRGSDKKDVDEDMESEDDFYKQVKQQRDAKLAAKSEKYSRNPTVQIREEEEELEVGKRHISYQMEKNRGLTRPRKKLIKNPRKKYKLKHQKAVERRKGQVRDIRKQTGSYGGENTGINPGISRSVRF
ncbi:something about silencing protein 10 isoform X2 [Impatiens glandulifera]|uniref:something about silencing protein 10 isoform X2 n=1 Tax=Impatiens glandulifera TaxID=253017 RepID=UPI001FB05FF0|nr:something about silencing protein 10 isoform X2 [Impatiens glandulifera]